MIIHANRGRQEFFTELVARLEGGDHFNFIESGEDELRAAFPSFEVIELGNSKAWYVGNVTH